jgi:hypothetical protein
MYDARAFPADVLLRLSRVHSQLRIDGQATPNPFHSIWRASPQSSHE